MISQGSLGNLDWISSTPPSYVQAYAQYHLRASGRGGYPNEGPQQLAAAGGVARVAFFLSRNQSGVLQST